MSPSSCPSGSASMRVTDTWETLAVVGTDTLWLVTAIPTYAVAPRGIVSLPIVVHDTPSADEYAVRSVPLRTRRTQRGADANSPEVFRLVAPVERRRWYANPFDADTRANACAE